jgi:hypothetical protein
MFQGERGDRQDDQASLIDQERVLVGAVLRAAVLDYPQTARGDLITDAMVKMDDAVADIFLKPLAR